MDTGATQLGEFVNNDHALNIVPVVGAVTRQPCHSPNVILCSDIAESLRTFAGRLFDQLPGRYFPRRRLLGHRLACGYQHIRAGSTVDRFLQFPL
jgi:hypothetical protein